MKDPYTRGTPAKDPYTHMTPIKHFYTHMIPMKCFYTRVTPLQIAHTHLTPMKRFYTRVTPLEIAYTRGTPMRDFYTREAPLKGVYTLGAPLNNLNPPINIHVWHLTQSHEIRPVRRDGHSHNTLENFHPFSNFRTAEGKGVTWYRGYFFCCDTLGHFIGVDLLP